MATKQENNEEESFIILGSSPGTSLDIKCNGVNGVLDKAQIEDALKDVTMETSASYKAHFNLAECPSPASMMAASTIITEDKSTGELQKRFGEILDENVVLKDTLKQNNDSMKEQFLLIASCQEDMLKAHEMHKEKFEETKELVERLRQENRKLKQEITQLNECPTSTVNGETGEVKADPVVCPKSGPSSALEFVTSPEDDTVDKLTAQLELVEKQRRQVITDNEKLTWQKESLENIVDATAKERDDLREKLKHVELQLSAKVTEHETELRELNYTIMERNNKLEALSVCPEDLVQRDAVIGQLEAKVVSLQADLKAAQLKIFEAENVKLEFSKHKSGVQEMIRVHKQNLEAMQNRLKEATTTVFQPVRLSVSSESDQGNLSANVKLYDRTLKHLADLLNKLTHGLSDSLVEALGVMLSLSELRIDRSGADQVKAGLVAVRHLLEEQQNQALANIGQVRGSLTIFEGIFKDYKEVLNNTTNERPSGNSDIKTLTAALVARGYEIQALETQLNRLKADREDTQLMTAQLDLYKSDFEAERQAREKMASEKDSLHTDLRKTQRRNEELTRQLEEVRRLNPGLHRSATSKPSQPLLQAPPAAATTGNMVYKCPKCMQFSCDQYNLMEEHLDFCLDDF